MIPRAFPDWNDIWTSRRVTDSQKIVRPICASLIDVLSPPTKEDGAVVRAVVTRRWSNVTSFEVICVRSMTARSLFPAVPNHSKPVALPQAPPQEIASALPESRHPSVATSDREGEMDIDIARSTILTSICPTPNSRHWRTSWTGEENESQQRKRPDLRRPSR